MEGPRDAPPSPAQKVARALPFCLPPLLAQPQSPPRPLEDGRTYLPQQPLSRLADGRSAYAGLGGSVGVWTLAMLDTWPQPQRCAAPRVGDFLHLFGHLGGARAQRCCLCCSHRGRRSVQLIGWRLKLCGRRLPAVDAAAAGALPPGSAAVSPPQGLEGDGAGGNGSGAAAPQRPWARLRQQAQQQQQSAAGGAARKDTRAAEWVRWVPNALLCGTTRAL